MSDSDLAVIRQVRPVLTDFVAKVMLNELLLLGLVEPLSDGSLRLTDAGELAAREFRASPHQGYAPTLWCCSDMAAVLNR